jgi:uncharacterized protein with HEPN domain
MRQALFSDPQALGSLCRRYRIRRLSLFGSTLKGAARPDSDVDLLVEFEPDARPSLLTMAEIERAACACVTSLTAWIPPFGSPDAGSVKTSTAMKCSHLPFMHALQIVGEAAGRISAETREQRHEVPWASMIGMRHRLVHAYFDINFDILWTTASETAPALLAQIRPLLASD